MPASPTPSPAVAYWRKNLLLVAILLTIWFVVAFLLGIVFVGPLNEFRLGGFPLGFWIAQQGSIVVFVLLVLAYALCMRWLDRHYDVHEEDTPPPSGPAAH